MSKVPILTNSWMGVMTFPTTGEEQPLQVWLQGCLACGWVVGMHLARIFNFVPHLTFVLYSCRLSVDLPKVSFGSTGLAILAGIQDIYQFLTSPWHLI